MSSNAALKSSPLGQSHETPVDVKIAVQPSAELSSPPLPDPGVASGVYVKGTTFVFSLSESQVPLATV